MAMIVTNDPDSNFSIVDIVEEMKRKTLQIAASQSTFVEMET